MVDNKHKVNSRNWAEWGEVGQSIFNQTYEWLISNQRFVTHPQQQDIPPEHWDTIAWNSAWVAAGYSVGHETEVVE